MQKINSERLSLLKRLSPLLKSDKKSLSAVIIIKIVGMALSLVSPAIYLLLVDDVMTDGKLKILWVVLIGYIGVFVIQTLCTIVNKKAYNHYFILFNTKLKTGLLQKITSLRVQDYEKFSSGDLKNRLESDSEVFEKFIMSHIVDYAYSILNCLIIGIILICSNWILAIVGFVMVPLSFWFSKVMAKKAGAVSNEYRSEYGEYESFIHNSVQGWKEVKSNQLENELTNSLSQKWQKLSKLFVRQQILWFINRSFIAFKDMFITKMNLYFIGGLLILNGNYEVAALLVFMNYYEQFFGSVSDITNLIVQFRTDKASISRVVELLDYVPPESNEYDSKSASITVDNVSFNYPACENEVLNRVSFSIPSQKHTAIVGRSGCGKSTLVKLILGIYEPVNGNVMIGEQRTANINWKRKMGVVMQEPTLFNLSIEENLRMVNRFATSEEIDCACKKTNIYDFIQNLPDGYQTMIGEKGVKLSGGQRQRIAIARVLLLDPQIVIFDEATSSLDYENEKAVIEALKNLSKGRTVISVSHRLSSIIDADQVVVVDGGAITGIGTHKELLNHNKLYDALFESQYTKEMLHNVNP